MINIRRTGIINFFKCGTVPLGCGSNYVCWDGCHGFTLLDTEKNRKFWERQKKSRFLLISDLQVIFPLGGHPEGRKSGYWKRLFRVCKTQPVLSHSWFALFSCFSILPSSLLVSKKNDLSRYGIGLNSLILLFGGQAILFQDPMTLRPHLTMGLPFHQELLLLTEV